MNINAVARIASLIGEPSRTAMLLQLMDGRALTARELVRAAGISAATGSRHLALLVDAQLLQVTAVGRHRYHRIASAQIALLMESIMGVARDAGEGAQPGRRVRTGPNDEALRRARTCYDHIAGRLGVAIAQRLADEGAVVAEADAGWVTDLAQQTLGQLGIDAQEFLASAGEAGRALCRPCMDWSERRFHLAGRLGAAICRDCITQGWLRHAPQTRALEITHRGRVTLRNWLGLDLWNSVTLPHGE